VALDVDLVAAAGVVLAAEEVVEADLVQVARDAYVEMCPPTPMPGRCARCTMIAAFQRMSAVAPLDLLVAGEPGLASGGMVLM
jgi:hypothetical protein